MAGFLPRIRPPTQRPLASFGWRRAIKTMACRRVEGLGRATFSRGANTFGTQSDLAMRLHQDVRCLPANRNRNQIGCSRLSDPGAAEYSSLPLRSDQDFTWPLALHVDRNLHG